MAVLEMQRIGICARKKDRKQILELLQRRGVVEIDTSPAEDESFHRMDTSGARAQFEQSMKQAEDALGILQRFAPEKTGMLASLAGKPEVDAAEYSRIAEQQEEILEKARQIMALDRRRAENLAEIQKCENAYEALEPWKDMDVPMNFAGTKRTTALIGTFPEQLDTEGLYAKIAEAAPEAAGVYGEVLSADTDQTRVFILTGAKDAAALEEGLRPLGFARPTQAGTTQTAAERREELLAQKETLAQENAKLEEQIAGFAGERETLRLTADYYRIRRDKYEVLGTLLQSKSTFLLTGYIPKRAAKALTEELEGKFTLAVETKDPGEEEETPVQLQNRTIPSSFEGVVASYGLPGKGEVDPTTVMSVCYIFLFGLMLSDAAYGFLIFAACFAALKAFPRMENGMRKALRMFMYCGLSTVFWGVMFGSYFGDVVDVVSRTFFGHEVSIGAVWFVPLNDPMKLLVFSMLFGVIHLFLGLGLKGYMLLKDKKYLDFVCDVLFWYMLVIGLILILLPSQIFVSISRVEFHFPAWLTLLSKVLAIGGAVGIVLMSGRAKKNWALRIALGAYDLYNVTGWLSDVLSYSRLLALGLATGVIASVINSMGAMLGNGVIGAIGFILIFLVGHTLNLAINLLGAYVHTNRLQYVEFFGKFYEGGGKPFNPFKIRTNYANIKEEKNYV